MAWNESSCATLPFRLDGSLSWTTSLHPRLCHVRLVLRDDFGCYDVCTTIASPRPTVVLSRSRFSGLVRPISLVKPLLRPVFFSRSFPSSDRTRFGFDRMERNIERRRVRTGSSTTVRRGASPFHSAKMRGCAWMCASSAPTKRGKMEANQPPVPKLNKQVRGWERK